MTDAISFATFAPYIGAAVSLLDGPKLTLVAVEQPKAHATVPAPHAAFSLILRGAPAPMVPEGMHRLILEGGPSFDLYLIPIHTPSRDHQDYQIVFN
jgi:hypothetical protein